MPTLIKQNSTTEVYYYKQLRCSVSDSQIRGIGVFFSLLTLQQTSVAKALLQSSVPILGQVATILNKHSNLL